VACSMPTRRCTRVAGDPDAAAQTDPALVQKATDVWSAIGCQVLKMTPENHDAAFAAVSHLPHLLAFAYFSAVARQPAGRDFLSLAGPGFRDFTRIAASDPGVWRDILVSNREEILKQISALPAHAGRHRARHPLGQCRGTRGPDPPGRRRPCQLADERRRQDSRLALTRMAALRLGGVRARLPCPPERCTRCPTSTSRPGPRCRHGAPAGLQEHLQPRAAARRPGAWHDRRARPARLRRHPGDARRAARWAAPSSVTARRCASGLGGRLDCRQARLFLGNAGTAMRPLTAALAVLTARRVAASSCPAWRACTSGRSATWSTRCAASAARSTDLGQPGYPPLRGAGPAALDLSRPIRVRGDVSSQFLTALLLALPLASDAGPVTIEVDGELISKPYVEITLNLLARFGIDVRREGWQRFTIPPAAPTARRAGCMSRATPRRLRTSSRWAQSPPTAMPCASKASATTRSRATSASSRRPGPWAPRCAPSPMRMEVRRGAWPLRAITLDCNHIPDAAMTLAVMALYADGPSTPDQHRQLARQGNRPHRRHGRRAAQARRPRGRRAGLHPRSSRPAHWCRGIRPHLRRPPHGDVRVAGGLQAACRCASRTRSASARPFPTTSRPCSRW
jgi:hypothetical protein